MVMIAATAVGLLPLRYLYNVSLAGSGLEDWSPYSVYGFAMAVSMLLTPMVFTWSAALWILRLRRPRPKLWQVYRQPGMTACSAVLVVTSFFFIKLTFLVGYAHLAEGIPLGDLTDWSVLPVTWFHYLDSIGISVLAVWMVLWLGKLCRPEPSWIDRTGRVTGSYCILCGLLFGWYGLAI